MMINFLLYIFSSFPQIHSTGLTDARGGDIGQKKFLNTIYSIVRKSLSWGDAQIFCDHHEGHLATFLDIKDAQEVIEQIFEISEKISPEYISGAKPAEWGLDRRYWIGLTDLGSGEGKWMWVGKGVPLTYNLWYPGQPDHIDKHGRYMGRPEHCVALWNPIYQMGDRRHSFVDVECNRKYYFICEKDDEKLTKQMQWKSNNQNFAAGENKMGRGIGLFTGRERDNNKPPVGPAQGTPGGAKGRAIINIPRMQEGRGVSTVKNMATGTAGNEFQGLFQPSGSESESEEKANQVSKSSEEFTPQDEVADVFAL